MGHLYEYLPEVDKLREHIEDGGGTACGIRPWSNEGEPSVDPHGMAVEDIWFGDHDRPDDIIPCAPCELVG